MKQTVLILLSAIFLLALVEARAYQKLSATSRSSHKLKQVSYVLRDGEILKIVKSAVRDTKHKPADWTAVSVFNGNDYNSTGWSILEVETNEKADDLVQAYSAGLVEGYSTRALIDLHLLNNVGDFCDKPSAVCDKLINFLEQNFEWISSQIKAHSEDPYWHHVNLVLHQFIGLYHGYLGNQQSTVPQDWEIFELLVHDVRPYLKLLALQMNGDMGELLASIQKFVDPFMAGSCSALIKILPENADLYVSHVTWGPYEVMLKVLKRYKLAYHLNSNDPALIPGSDISFSSYPGILTSIDDFFIINTQLVVQETTIGNSNVELWKFVTPETNLYWMRVMIANRLAVTGADWAKWFSMYNSGTYNNEWMIVDYKRFVPGQPLRDGLLTVLEQMPGQTVWNDKTDVLRAQSYWPSYNIAYYPYVYNTTGTYDDYVKFGDFFSYDNSPRASIFRRDQSNVVDMDSMIRLMRSNNFTHDPLSRCDCSPPYSGENAIAARSDLNPNAGKYPFDALGHRDHGATDMKVTNRELMINLELIAVAGPTYDDQDITPFVWSEADFGNSTNHFGHPDKWMFKPYHIQWTL